MSEDKLFQNEEGKKKLQALENAVLVNKKDDESEEDEESGGEGGGGDDKKDDDQNFIKKDEQSDEMEGPEAKRQKVFHDLEVALDGAVQDLESAKGVRPEGNQQRNLDRETGGLEAAADQGISDEDVWDKRGEEVAKMIEDGRDLNNASKSSRAQGFIHVGKQRKKNRDIAADAAEGYVAKLTKFRQNKEDAIGRDTDGSGGRVM